METITAFTCDFANTHEIEAKSDANELTLTQGNDVIAINRNDWPVLVEWINTLLFAEVG